MRGLLTAGGILVGDDHPRPLAGEYDRRCPPEPRPAAGNECHAAVERGRKPLAAGTVVLLRTVSHYTAILPL